MSSAWRKGGITVVKLPGYYTTAELAAAAGLSQNTIRYHCDKGRLHAVAVWTESQWLIPDAAAKSFIDSFRARITGVSKGGDRA